MPRRLAEDDWDDEYGRGDGDDDDFAADDYGDDSFDDSDDEPTIPCPYCHRAIHEDSPRCPYCENYISAEDSPRAGKSWLLILGTLITLVVIYVWIMH